MLTRILHNSPQLCTFLDQLNLELYQSQRRHMLNLADALLVCEDKKTIAALQRQFVEAPDASNMGDFLRHSPWAVRTSASQLVEHAYRISSLLWNDTEVTEFASLVSRASQIRALGN